MKVLILLSVVLVLTEASKILVVFPLAAKSHSILGDGFVRHLLNDGHEVTYITSIPWKDPPPNLHIIDVKENFDHIPANLMNIKSHMKQEAVIDDVGMPFFGILVNEITLRHQNVQELLMDTTQHFDLVIAEWMFQEMYATLAQVFDCPLIWSSSLDMHWQIRQFVDGMSNPSHNPSMVSQAQPPFTFLQRLNELWSQIKVSILERTIIRYQASRLYQELVVPAIEKRGRLAPSYADTLYNVSLMFLNTHPPLSEPIDLPVNVKYIGGYHIEPPKPLPQDLQKFMDESEHGVIYFSMGSNLKSKDMPEKLKQDLVKLFGELKYTVIWKFEEDLANAPKNLVIVKWAPQTSILAHPNCKLFITHGGLLSFTETIYFGVPVIGIPVFGDQFVNAARFENKGLGKKVDLSETIAADLKEAITEMLSTPKYAEKVKELSKIFLDRTVPPGTELTHWVNHVIRTRGAQHLRSKILIMPLYQRYYLDFIVLILIVLWLLKKATIIIFRVLKVFKSIPTPDRNKKRN